MEKPLMQAPDEAASLLRDIDAAKGMAGKDWSARQARRLGLDDAAIKQLLSAQ